MNLRNKKISEMPTEGGEYNPNSIEAIKLIEKIATENIKKLPGMTSELEEDEIFAVSYARVLKSKDTRPVVFKIKNKKILHEQVLPDMLNYEGSMYLRPEKEIESPVWFHKHIEAIKEKEKLAQKEAVVHTAELPSRVSELEKDEQLLLGYLRAGKKVEHSTVYVEVGGGKICCHELLKNNPTYNKAKVAKL